MTSDFFNATILATAKRIAALFTSGNVTDATKQLEMYLGDLDVNAGTAFVIAVQDYIQGKR